MNYTYYLAIDFAHAAHHGQKRKYTGEPYTNHLAEVAGIVSVVAPYPESIAVAWLHDVIEDTPTTHEELQDIFGPVIADAVLMLSDLETEGNRAKRKAASRDRLSKAEGWIQTIKVADLLSNTSSIADRDPKFAEGYLEEKRLLLDVLTKANPSLLELARTRVSKLQC